MQNNIPFHQNNLEYNPLFAKMKDRFCTGGTIAEKMQKKAEEYLKNNPAQTCGEYHMTHANSLPKRAENKKKNRTFKSSFFSMRNISTACMALLIGGTVLFSCASVGNLFSSVGLDTAENAVPSIAEETLIFEQDVPFHLEETVPAESSAPILL